LTSTGKHANKGSPLIHMANMIDVNMECSSPFHTQNTPHSYRVSSLPFTSCFFIDNRACAPDDRKSLVANQRMWLLSSQGRRTLNIFTDGSKTDKAAGWAVRGIHAGRVMFQFSVPYARKASSHDAEMMALAHASKLVAETMLGKRSIREFRFFSDSMTALTSIFDPRPHPSQQASLLFRSNMHRLFSERKDITGCMLWTPGHGGLEHMNITIKNTK